ncbi:MAG: LysM peptidoglycan-binding domain-containing protein [Muribaculaceae bacterium]|nr:LysM peptidoglycan-binding domain-containing protein [Muribaculaceae bacterium]
MNYIRLAGTFLVIGYLCMAAKIDVFAAQFDYSPVAGLSQEEDTDNYIRLTCGVNEYEIKPGDTLWDIAEDAWGNGSAYRDILEANKEILVNPDYILPGEIVVIPAYLYLPKSNTPDTAYSGAYRIERADMEYDSYPLGAYVYLAPKLPRIKVYTEPVANRMGENALTDDWEDFVGEVERCSRELCADRVSNLTFEKYEMENGCDLCGYTFTFDAGDIGTEVAVFYRLGKQNMAEVIGVRKKQKKEDTVLTDAVRYIAASFEDLGGRIEWGTPKRNDNVGADEWAYPELHNVFAALMKSHGLSLRKPEQSIPGDEELILEEPLFEQAFRNALIALWQLDDTEKAAFLNRPLMKSDAAVITEISCSWNHHADTSNELEVTITFNGHAERIKPGEEKQFSFADLTNFPEVKSLHLYHVRDYSFLLDMAYLKELSIDAGSVVSNVDFLSEFKDLRLLELTGGGFGMLTDLGVLRNCKNLKYLFLQTPRLCDFSFLEDCKEICTIELSGSLPRQENALFPTTPDLKLLPRARFIEFYGRSIRCEP